METVHQRVEAVRARPFEPVTGEADDGALTTGLVQAWIADASDALGRLMVAGIAHPDPELPETFDLLSERAAALGTGTAARGFAVLAEWTRALRPGPPDLTTRMQLAHETWREAMALLAWLRLFRADIDLASAAVRARGERSDGAERADLPRYTDRVYVDGLTLSAEQRLVVVGHDEHGQQVLAFDPLASGDADDPFGSPVISRLFQEQMWLGDLAGCALDFDRHPYTRRGNTILVQPAFRAVPLRLPTDRPLGGPGVEVFEAHCSADGEALVVRPRDGGRVVVGRTFEFNVRKRLAALGRPGLSLRLVGLPRREGRVIIACDDEGQTRFPAIDARCWRVHPEVLAAATVSASVWLRAAAAMFGGHPGPERERLFRDVATAKLAGLDAWRLVWWSARLGADALDLVVPEVPGPSAEDGFVAVWGHLWNGGGEDALKALYAARYESVPEPALPDVCARTLLLDAVTGDRDAALAYLEAHLVHLRRTGKSAPVLPPSLHLVMLADTLAWLTAGDRSGPVGDALQLPSVPLRERLAQKLYRWRVHGETHELADTLALGALCAWGATVVG
ncbi:MAG: hypothetical protein H6737_30230 [Alphaproteobacteria bacterium]|nr:hypothetical protein [Alphaproteobacteria bacterium]